MKKLLVVSTLMVVSLSLSIGCRKVADAVQAGEVDIAEALAEQAISGYHTAAVSVSVNSSTFSVSCASGGTLEWSLVDGDDICYETVSKNCTLAINDKEITLNGTYKICGYPERVEDATGAEDLEGEELSISGTVTATGTVAATGETLTSRTCEYAFTVNNMDVSGTGDSVTMALDIEGNLCGDKGFELSTSVTVSGSTSVESGSARP